MKQASKGKYSAFFALKKKLEWMGDLRDRSEIISDFTEGKKSSLTQLSPWEYKELVRTLGATISKEFKQDDKLDRQRKQVIANLANSGFVKEGKADMQRINEWCVKYGHLNKPLNDYVGVNLSKLIVQSEKVYTKFLDSL